MRDKATSMINNVIKNHDYVPCLEKTKKGRYDRTTIVEHPF